MTKVSCQLEKAREGAFTLQLDWTGLDWTGEGHCGRLLWLGLLFYIRKWNDIAELMMNQKHILEAIKYLNERIEYKAKNENTNEVNDILESQAMIDQIIVKNADDI